MQLITNSEWTEIYPGTRIRIVGKVPGNMVDTLLLSGIYRLTDASTKHIINTDNNMPVPAVRSGDSIGDMDSIASIVYHDTGTC